MELILVVVISAGMAENSQNGVSRSLNRTLLCDVNTLFLRAAATRDETTWRRDVSDDDVAT